MQPHKAKKHNLQNKRFNMMKDFDVLVMNKKQQKPLYQKANYQKGLKMMNQTYIRDKDGQNYSIFVPIEEFQKYGPGIYLLFLFLKYSTIAFFIVSFLSFISLGILTSDGPLSYKQTTFQIAITRTTLGNIQPQSSQLLIIIFLDYFITFLILILIIIWKQKQPSYVVECCKDIMLPSYQTIILKQIPDGYTEYQMKQFFKQKFGQVQDIYTVRNFHNDLFHYKEISQIIKQYKEQRAMLKLTPQKNSLNLAKLFFKYEQYYNYILERDKIYKYPKQLAFITFKTIKTRQQVLKFYQKTYPQLEEDKKQFYQYKSQQLKIKPCLMQPNGIKWQNLNIPKKYKIMWAFIQIFLLTFVLIISIAIIFILYEIQNSLSLTKYHGMPKQAILKLNSQQALQSYCLGLSVIKFNSDQDCSPFAILYTQYIIYFIAIPLSLSLFKFLLTEIMRFLVNLRRHPYQIAQIQSQIVIMFVFYFFASGVLQYLAFLQINFDDGTTFSFFNIINPIHNLFFSHFFKNTFIIERANDYNKEWYFIVSEKVILIAVASFNISSVGKIVYSMCKKILCNFYAKKQLLQCRMNHWLQGQQLQIQFVYAVAATIINFLLLFSCCMPLLYPFTCISLFVLFWCTKIIFIKYCAKPLLYSHSMNSLIVNILLSGIIMHSIVTPIYFGSQDIYSKEGIRYSLRLLYFGYYIVMILVPLIYIFYREKIMYLFEKLKSYYQNDGLKEHKQFVFDKKVKIMSLPSKLCLIQSKFGKDKDSNKQIKKMSYSMHENQDYQLILKTLYTINRQQRARVSCILNQDVLQFIQNNQTLVQLNQKSYSQTYLFHQLLILTQQNHKKFQKTLGPNYSKSNNPYQSFLLQLKQIKAISDKILNDPSHKVFQFGGFKSTNLLRSNQKLMKNNNNLSNNKNKMDNLNNEKLNKQQEWKNKDVINSFNLINNIKKRIQFDHMNNPSSIIVQNAQQQQYSNNTNHEQSINQQDQQQYEQQQQYFQSQYNDNKKNIQQVQSYQQQKQYQQPPQSEVRLRSSQKMYSSQSYLKNPVLIHKNKSNSNRSINSFQSKKSRKSRKSIGSKNNSYSNNNKNKYIETISTIQPGTNLVIEGMESEKKKYDDQKRKDEVMEHDGFSILPNFNNFTMPNLSKLINQNIGHYFGKSKQKVLSKIQITQKVTQQKQQIQGQSQPSQNQQQNQQQPPQLSHQQYDNNFQIIIHQPPSSQTLNYSQKHSKQQSQNKKTYININGKTKAQIIKQYKKNKKLIIPKYSYKQLPNNQNYMSQKPKFLAVPKLPPP